VTVSHHDHDHDHDHDHSGPHDHVHDDGHVREPRLPPSTEGSVVMEVGGDVGALVVYTGDGLAGHEIELARRGERVQFVHTEVRERRLPDGAIFAGVFPALPAGAYTLLAVKQFPAIDVDVEGGRVAECSWSK
jgi:hypothetical protein